MRGGPDAYKKCLIGLGGIEAELKLVIAGNHDRDLDKDYCLRNYSEEDGDEPEEHAKAMEVMTGPLAKDAGVTYLEEGIHEFALSNGATFKVYASPYQPEFCNWAFPYERDQDRFNSQHQSMAGVTSIATNPIPDFGAGGVDIVMTHGPPKSILDACERDGFEAGCENILRAIARAKPLLHCFGHIHEGYGACKITWKDGKIQSSEDILVNAYPDPTILPIEAGKETLMVNASIMTVRYRPENAPWLIDLELPRR